MSLSSHKQPTDDEMLNQKHIHIPKHPFTSINKHNFNCRCRFLILFGINCMVERSSRSQKQNQISLLAQAFAS